MIKLGTRSNLVVAASLLLGLVLAASVVHGFSVLRFFDADEAGEISEVDAIAREDEIEQLSFLFYVAVLAGVALTAIAVSAWLYGAMRNLGRSGELPGSSWEPAWAIWGWIIPLGNLFIPYAVMRWAWAGSRWLAEAPERRDESMIRARDPLILGWWLAWLAWVVLGRVTNALYQVAWDYADLRRARHVEMTVDVIGIGALVMLVMIVRRTTALQAAASGNTSAAPVPKGPPDAY